MSFGKCILSSSKTSFKSLTISCREILHTLAKSFPFLSSVLFISYHKDRAVSFDPQAEAFSEGSCQDWGHGDPEGHLGAWTWPKNNNSHNWLLTSSFYLWEISWVQHNYVSLITPSGCNMPSGATLTRFHGSQMRNCTGSGRKTG